MESEWKCTVVNSVVGYAPLDVGQKAERPALRLGLRYVRGLREEAVQALVRERNQAPFTSIHDLVHRVPELRRDELNTLAEIGALNSVLSSQFPVPSDWDTEVSNWRHETRNSKLHRRDALWQVERAARYSGPLLEELPEPDSKSPLERMNDEERLVADFRGTGLTVGILPNQYNVISVTAERVLPLAITQAETFSHDFY